MIYAKVLAMDLVTGRHVESSGPMPSTLRGLPVEESEPLPEVPRGPQSDSDVEGAARSVDAESGKDWLAEGQADNEVAAVTKYPSVRSTRCTALPPGTFALALLSEPSNLHGRSAEGRYADGYVQCLRTCGLAGEGAQSDPLLAYPAPSLCQHGSAAEAAAVSTLQQHFFRRVDNFEVNSDSLNPFDVGAGDLSGHASSIVDEKDKQKASEKKKKKTHKIQRHRRKTEDRKPKRTTKKQKRNK